MPLKDKFIPPEYHLRVGVDLIYEFIYTFFVSVYVLFVVVRDLYMAFCVLHHTHSDGSYFDGNVVVQQAITNTSVGSLFSNTNKLFL